MWGVFVLCLVLCAIVGTQHNNQHICVFVAARVLPVRAVVAARARDGRRRIAWRPGQRACAGRVGEWAHHCVLEGKVFFQISINYDLYSTNMT